MVPGPELSNSGLSLRIRRDAAHVRAVRKRSSGSSTTAVLLSDQHQPCPAFGAVPSDRIRRPVVHAEPGDAAALHAPNVIAPVMTRGEEMLLQTIYYPLLMYARRREGTA